MSRAWKYVEKSAFLVTNGWIPSGIRHWVKAEWLKEPEDGMNAYRTETLEDAFTIAKIDEATADTKASCKYETAVLLERVLLEALRCGKDDMPSETRNFAKNMLLPWYLNECNNKPNPLIKIGFKIKTQFKLED